jgi:AcrR family transcriptional regulator
MGRRSSHSPEELRELILEAATGLIEKGGLAALSAREVARVIGYSPGTLYNVFADLDDLILTVEQRLLDRLEQRLLAVPKTSDSIQHLCDLAEAYLAFTQEKPRLWNLLLEHHMPHDWKVPAAFHQRIEALLVCVEQALQPLIVSEQSEATRNAARVLWASVHGVTSLAATSKLSHVTPDLAGVLVDELVRNFLAGLIVNQAKRREPGA